VVANLIANAVQYAPAGDGQIEIGGKGEDGAVLFWVRDNGSGIPEEYHRRIFELYGQVPLQAGGHNGDGRGTGVGLAIVKRIVEQHGGAVWVESLPEGGSRFCVRLPQPSERVAVDRP
jgi:signal transduction histidine kinase